MSDELHEQIKAANERAFQDQKAEAARVRAAATDKEPFSRDAFENEMGLLGEAREDRSQRELDMIEIRYYLSHRDMKTLRELALAVAGA